jgi:hypothetical protein
MRFIVLCVLEKNFVHISTGILEQLVGLIRGMVFVQRVIIRVDYCTDIESG